MRDTATDRRHIPARGSTLYVQHDGEDLPNNPPRANPYMARLNGRSSAVRPKYWETTISQSTTLRRMVMTPMLGTQHRAKKIGRPMVSRGSLSHTAQVRKLRMTGCRQTVRSSAMTLVSLSGVLSPIHSNHDLALNTEMHASAPAFCRPRSIRRDDGYRGYEPVIRDHTIKVERHVDKW
jgi:hypothetical protein